jgi:catechol 2,3-dioxygenase-like lactoylglutathione lyase family enzyme
VTVSPLTRNGAGRLVGVDHLAVLVADIDEALPEFLDGLGLTLVSDETLSEPAVRLVHLDAGNVDLQLVAPLGPGRIQDDLGRTGPGLHHVCFGVADLVGALNGLGQPLDGMFTGGQGRPACFLSSRPSQVFIELIECEGDDAYGTLDASTQRVTAYWADECSRDLDRMMTHFAPDAEVITPDGSFTGYRDIAALYQKSFSTYPELEVAITGRYAGRGSHCFEFAAVLTDIAGVRHEVRGVNVVTLRQGLISRMRSFEDPPTPMEKEEG